MPSPRRSSGPAAQLRERTLPLGIDGKPVVARRNGQQPIRVFDDVPKEILTRHDYGAAGIHYTLNPYRGCTFACVYCSARPTHEYLSDGIERWNSGPDFDSRIVARPEAPHLLDEALSRKKMRARVIHLSGATDPYQPLEAGLQITRACLEVCLRHGNPVALQTKSTLVTRDLDLLLALHRGPGVHVALSLAALDEKRALALEPGAPSPQARLAVVGRLAAAGVPVGISIAPAILGLTETDIVRILTSAKDAGASTAYYLRLRLPGLIEPQLVRRVRASLPDRARRVVEGLGGHGAAPSSSYAQQRGQRYRGASSEDPMEQIFCFTAERLGLRFLRHAPWPASVAQLEAQGLSLAEARDRRIEAERSAPSPAATVGQLSLF